MNKKAQVTMFIIIGIVIVVLAALLIYLKDIIFFAPSTVEDLSVECEEIQDHIKECVEFVSEQPIKTIGLQGGYLVTAEDTYRLYNGSRVSYLCFNMRDKTQCRNRMLQESDMEEQLQSTIQQSLKECINVKGFESARTPYNVIPAQDYETTININLDEIEVDVNYPIKLKSKRSALEVDCNPHTVHDLDYPLGRIFNVVLDIVDSEAEYGEFEQLVYMLAKKGQFMIYKERPYPDKIYRIKTKDNPYVFQFFIEGEPS